MQALRLSAKAAARIRVRFIGDSLAASPPHRSSTNRSLVEGRLAMIWWRWW
jgi:hypothetical protein